MKKELIMNEWSFYRGLPDRFAKPDKATLDLPHDMQIGLEQSKDADASSGFYPPCAGTYEKALSIPREWEGEKVFVEFDGVYGNTTVSLNGSRLYFHPYGYTPFLVDITRMARFGGPNRLEVAVDNTKTPNCRWYSGAGIYRDVHLLHGPLCRIQHRGIYLKTECINIEESLKTATVLAEVGVINEGALPFCGHVDLTLTAPDGCKTRGRAAICLEAGEEAAARLRLVVQNPHVWDIESPALYSVEAALTPKGESAPVDSDSCRFGIRTVTVDAVHGFRLNGKPIKLKGGCVHHAASPLGAADFDDQTRRLLKAHKEAGYNALRMAHNPPSERFLDLCDEYGILIADEAFDGWHIGKTPYGYHEFFDEWWERDMEAFVLHDRNHPSVVIWSIGNEVYERAGMADGYIVSRRLAEKVRSLDSTRPVMQALCTLWTGLDDADAAELAKRGEESQFGDSGYAKEIWADRTESVASPLDIVGYNYMDDRYIEDHKTFPDRVICGTESFPMMIDKVWALVEANPHVIGDFTWTSADYIGEAGIGAAIYADPDDAAATLAEHLFREYPWKLAYDADWDILLMPRPQLAYRQIVWGQNQTFIAARDPATYGKKELLSRWAWPQVWNSWTWPGFEGKPIQIDVYSPGDRVELFINGRKINVASVERFTARFEAVYEPGAIEAVSYKGSDELSRQRLETAGEPARLILRPESSCARADGESLLFVLVEIEDASGRRVPGIRLPMTAAAEGAASLISFASANPVSCENYQSGRATSFDGRAMAVLRAGHKPGEARLTVTCEGLDSASVELNIRA